MRVDAPFSVDANLLHASSEGKVLEDPAQEVPDYVYSRTLDPQAAPDRPAYVEVEFERGDAVALDGRRLSDRKSTRLNSSHRCISYAVFCLKKKTRLISGVTAIIFEE